MGQQETEHAHLVCYNKKYKTKFYTTTIYHVYKKTDKHLPVFLFIIYITVCLYAYYLPISRTQFIIFR